MKPLLYVPGNGSLFCILMQGRLLFIKISGKCLIYDSFQRKLPYAGYVQFLYKFPAKNEILAFYNSPCGSPGFSRGEDIK